MDQFTAFAEELSTDFTVLSFDSLGFGYSEKPPLSYNQYLWRYVRASLKYSIWIVFFFIRLYDLSVELESN